MLLTEQQTNKQTNATENITSLAKSYNAEKHQCYLDDLNID